VFSNGIIILTTIAVLLIYWYDASPTRLIQLYIVGVFVSFTLSQAGMVVHWTRLLRRPGDTLTGGRSMGRKRALNALGAAMTSVVLVVVMVSKFTHGAWMVVIAIPVLVLVMLGIRRHYDNIDI